MTVGSIDPSANSAAAALQVKLQQARANVDKLQQSLEAGNLAGAQQAFAALQQTAAPARNNPQQTRIDALGQALKSGNVGAAQQAFSALQAAASAQGGQGSHNSGAGGGGGGGSGGSSSSSKTVVSETTTTSATGVITTVVTYANGTSETLTSYGPAPSSSQSVIV